MGIIFVVVGGRNFGIIQVKVVEVEVLGKIDWEERVEIEKGQLGLIFKKEDRMGGGYYRVIEVEGRRFKIENIINVQMGRLFSG